jgi:ABC-type multidrug transport system permease subunit
MPFALAAPSLIRERDARTLEVLLAAPMVGRGSIFVGKTLAPVLVTLVLSLLMLVLLQSVYGIGVKAGIVLAMLFLIPPILSSTFLGLLVSATLRSQSQALIALFLYLLGLTLLSGLFYPIEEASKWIQVFSKLIPSTFIPPSLNAWMYGAPAASKMAEASPWLVGQSLAFGALSLIAYQRLLRRI